MRAHDAPLGHSRFSRPPQDVATPHSPGVAARTRFARRRQSFQYVTPSQPQLGDRTSSHAMGATSQRPVASPQLVRAQNCDDGQLPSSVQADELGVPPSLAGRSASTTS
jgi:hypothetical protein